MKLKFFIVFSFVNLGLFLRPDVAFCTLVGAGSSITGVSPLNGEGAAALQQQEQIFQEQRRIQEEEAEQEAAIAQEKQTEFLAKLQTLKDDLASKLQDATNALFDIDTLRQQFLDAKKHIPEDPWREINGEKKYVMSENSEFVNFSGQIQEVGPTGVRILGQYGNLAGQEEYFLINFPYKVQAGEYINPSKIYVAVEDGQFGYVTEDGLGKHITQLNYGNPCARPSNADSVEKLALQLTPDEESRINSAKADASAKSELAVAAQKRLQDFLDKNDPERIAAAQRKASEELGLEFDLREAVKGDPIGLLSMGERYRDGNGVPKDSAKAKEFLGKAAAAGNQTAVQELSKLTQDSTATNNISQN
jgi:hypothetical protein